MKIICIGRNYAEHAKEMKADLPTEPVFFMKPDTALLKDADFYLPDFTKDLHHEIELVIKISKAGKHIEEQFAHKYYNEIGLGIDFTARDIQAKCKEKGLPWEKAKAFDNSAPIGGFVNKEKLDLSDIKFELKI
ncbi:MAG: fumarylacetoacetate hydrolase family protein, partial [Bacteroidia bacterium]|nr:fumarylacetoacetate hydrolase family protein [Bacteroidia bacterium]